MKDRRTALFAVLVALPPLIAAVTGWVEAATQKKKADAVNTELFAALDAYQETIEYVMEQEGCEP